MFHQSQLRMTPNQFPLLKTQEEFETLLCPPNGNKNDYSPLVIVYFTANWCGACKRIDWSKIQPEKHIGITWLLCDVDKNDYTPGYCGVKSIPAFQALIYGRHEPLFQSNSADDILSWLCTLVEKVNYQ